MGDVKNILLTGATGYLGRNLLTALLMLNYEVSVLARKTSNVNSITKLENVKIYYAEDDLNLIFDENNIDTVIHTAALYGRKGESIADIVDANLHFPLRLLETCLKYKVLRFINTDTSLPKLLNSYALSKNQFLDWLLLNSSNIKVLNLQLEYFFGPGDDVTKFITYVLNEIYSGAKHIDFTEATSYRDFVYIDDLINAYLTILNNTEKFDSLTNIPVGSGSAIMLKDIILQIKDIAGADNVKLNFGALPMRKNEVMYSCANIEILKSIGWVPEYTFSDGIKKIILFDRENHDRN